MSKALSLSLLLLSIGFLISCRQKQQATYSIADYPAKLQPVLYSLVNTGIHTYDTAYYYIKNQTTDKELIKLSQCEHPLIRAHALIFLLKRPEIDKERLINEHLGDTAVITVDWGEFGIGYQQISDLVLEHGEWDDSAAKAKTINLVMTQHNQLISAYTILNELNQEPAYYPVIREMTQRNYYQGGEEYGKIGFPEYRHLLIACRALAAYKNPEDIPLITKVLEKNMWRWTDDAFFLMDNYPNERYLELLEKYYNWQFYRRLCNDLYPEDNSTNFINTVAAYKNKRSADILSSILNSKQQNNCRSYLTDVGKSLTIDVYEAIKKNPSPAYKAIEPEIPKQKEGETLIMVTGNGRDPNGERRKLRW